MSALRVKKYLLRSLRVQPDLEIMKENNEITVRICCTKNELIHILTQSGFAFDCAFCIDDIYFFPKGWNRSASPRELLRDAVLVRVITEGEDVLREITYKIKDINAAGEILSQQVYNCRIADEAEAIALLSAMGYERRLRIREDDLVYTRDGLGLVIKDVQLPGEMPDTARPEDSAPEDAQAAKSVPDAARSMGLMMEIETVAGSPYDTAEKLIAFLQQSGIPHDSGNYYVKKAELALAEN